MNQGMLQARSLGSSCTPQSGSRKAGRCNAVSIRASFEQLAVTSRRALVAGLAIGLVSSQPAFATDTFLKSAGDRGFLADEEEALYRLRQEKEASAWRSLEQERATLERMIEADKAELARETRASQEGKFCATPFGVDVAGITEFIALVGALVGGIAANKRKKEADRLNEQLRKINLQLRQQARAGTIYAPGLSYAPTGDVNGAQVNGSMPPAAAPKPTTKVSSGVMISVSMEDDEMNSDQLACRDALKAGKKLLKDKNGPASMVRFEKAMMMSRALGDKIQERRAYRGLAAASRLQGQYTNAIKYLERVLEISQAMHEFTGDSDAFGTIADCYTDMGEFEKAAVYYDKYISAMNTDTGVLV